MSFPFVSTVPLAVALWAAADPTEPLEPNVLVILSDDTGYSDLGCYGGEIRTPNLDTLPAGGLQITQFYNTARYSPTRASLLTGRYPHQAGVGQMIEDRDGNGDGSRCFLNHSRKVGSKSKLTALKNDSRPPFSHSSVYK
jgi:arylsulfatase